jgi:nitrite reductase/ring-hydroxylating ferredoxin subunit
VRLSSVLSKASNSLEHARGIDRLADPLNDLVGRCLPPGRMRSLISGSWLGHPLHPFLVSAPIGCWTSASVLDVLGHRRSAQTLVGLGVIAVAPTAVTGLSDWADTSGAERRIGFIHLVANFSAAGAYALSWLARRNGRHALGVGLAVAGAGAATGAGWLGGHLAYGMGVGVDTNAFDAGPVEWTALEPAVSADTRGVARSAVGPTAVLVSGRSDGVDVLADRCSHRGAPLSDGEVADGCVTCPWHGSRFDLTSGAVVRGPAVVPQPVYQTRRAGDALEVRRDEVRALRANTTHP